jgi:hypothetical protein
MGKAWRHGGYPIAVAEVYVTQLANETRPSVVEENTRAVLRLVLSSEVADIVPLPSERLARDYRQVLYRMLLTETGQRISEASRAICHSDGFSKNQMKGGATVLKLFTAEGKIYYRTLRGVHSLVSSSTCCSIKSAVNSIASIGCE